MAKVFKVTNIIENKVTGQKEVDKAFDNFNKKAKESNTLVGTLNSKIAALKSRQEFARTEDQLKKVNKELDQANRELSRLQKLGTSQGGIAGQLNSAFGTLGKTIVAAFAVERVIAFGKETFDLAVQADGVKRAFDKLNDPTLLDDLRKQTRGTVSDLTLMRAAVKAENYGIELRKLGSFFEFAALRAQQTGENVDTLVDNIVDGIGKKSLKILDNFQISAETINQELLKTPDIATAMANIIQSEVKKAGDITGAASEDVNRLNASFQNTKVSVGETLIELGTPFIVILTAALEAVNKLAKGQFLFNSELNDTSDVIKKLNTEELKEFEVSIERLALRNEELSRGILLSAQDEERILQQAIDNVNKRREAQELLNKSTGRDVNSLNALNEKLKELSTRLNTLSTDSAEFGTLKNEIDLLTLQIDELSSTDALPQLQPKEIKPIISELQNLNAEIKAVDKSLQEANVTSERVVSNFEQGFKMAFEEIAQAANQILFDQINAGLQNQINDAQVAAQEQSDINSKFYDDELLKFQGLADNKKISSEQLAREQELISLRRAQAEEKIQKDLAKKEAELKRKQAIADKAGALFSILINTQNAASAALATPPAPNIPLAIAAGIAGAAQAAIVLARPIPQFAKGKKKEEKAGLSLVGEKGAEYMYVPHDATILNSSDTKKHEGILRAIQDKQLDDFIIKNYSDKILNPKLGDLATNMAKGIQLHNHVEMSDMNIVRQLKKNRNIRIENASDIGREVAREMRRNQFYENHYGRA